MDLNARSSESTASNWHLTRRLLELCWAWRGRCLAVLAAQSVVVLLGVGGLNVIGVGIDVLHHYVDPSSAEPRWPLGLTPPEAWSTSFRVIVLAVTSLLMAFALAVLQYTAVVAQARLVQDLIVHMRRDVYDKLQRLSFKFFDANETGSIINRVTGDVQGIRLFLQMVVMQSLLLLITILVFLGYMLSISPVLTLACMATTPLLWFIAIAYGRKVKPAYKENRRLLDHAVRVLSENLQGVHVVKGFARQPEQVATFREANEAVNHHKRWIFGWHATFTAGVNFLTQMNLVILLGFGGYLVISGQIHLGTGLVVFATLLQQISNQVTNVAGIANSVQQSLSGAERVFEILDAPVEIHSPEQPVPLPDGRAVGHVSFHNVSFAYHDDSEPALHEITFDAKPGACVAVLGPCGAGKSTLMSLVPRFYDPQQGSVRIDGVDVREYDVDELRRNIGMVFQESFLFSNTVAANISFGHPDATREQVEQAARIACAHDFVSEMPEGYDTIIGENGVDLSGGQRQRLAIARALLLEPPILLMDDPTAAIDPETEHEILAAMDNAMKGRTTFLVAHRLSTLRRADQVIVLDKGRVVQHGTHDSLMGVKGMYRKAAKLQVADDESRQLLAQTGLAV